MRGPYTPRGKLGHSSLLNSMDGEAACCRCNCLLASPWVSGTQLCECLEPAASFTHPATAAGLSGLCAMALQPVQSCVGRLADPVSASL